MNTIGLLIIAGNIFYTYTSDELNFSLGWFVLLIYVLLDMIGKDIGERLHKEKDELIQAQKEKLESVLKKTRITNVIHEN